MHIDRLVNGYVPKMMTANLYQPTLVTIQQEKMSLKVFCPGLQSNLDQIELAKMMQTRLEEPYRIALHILIESLQ